MAMCVFSDFWLLSKVILMVNSQPSFVPDARGRSVDCGGSYERFFLFALLV